MKVRAATEADIPGVRGMLRAYVDWIALDLAFQEVDAELAGLPGEYVPPSGALLVAGEVGAPVAMVGLRRLDAATCEMKRLYVDPSARGRGLARALLTRVLAEARARGYREMRLDTLPMMGDAQALYAAFGFRDIDPYYDTPIAGTRFMALTL
jgi:ribosomal protein S18 acetylase RimI-like enzyme